MGVCVSTPDEDDKRESDEYIDNLVGTEQQYLRSINMLIASLRSYSIDISVLQNISTLHTDLFKLLLNIEQPSDLAKAFLQHRQDLTNAYLKYHEELPEIIHQIQVADQRVNLKTTKKQDNLSTLPKSRLKVYLLVFPQYRKSLMKEKYYSKNSAEIKDINEVIKYMKKLSSSVENKRKKSTISTKSCAALCSKSEQPRQRKSSVQNKIQQQIKVHPSVETQLDDKRSRTSASQKVVAYKHKKKAESKTFRSSTWSNYKPDP